MISNITPHHVPENKAFTIIELMIVVIIVSIITSFGLPNFSKTLDRAKAKDALNNLSMIHAANKIYYSRQKFNLGSVGAVNLSGINTHLGLNINANGATYLCQTVAGVDKCTATSSVAGVFSETVNLKSAIDNTTNPSCTGTMCP
jgi:prepilin-type N-terminal cleavage/methylation domain-containing protein